MEQHPIPRQITSFEFKLIGFLTIRQFIYLIVFLPLGFLTYKIFPIPLINILLGIIVAGLGPALAFIPINDRPMEVFIKNLMKRLTSATQYSYKKNNPPIYFLKNLVFLSDPHLVLSHVDSQEKLNTYLAMSKKKPLPNKKQAVNLLLHKPSSSLIGTKPLTVQPQPIVANQSVQPKVVTSITTPTVAPATAPITQPIVQTETKRTFFTGIVKNYRLLALPGILIYVKNSQGETLRLLKTNPHGIFATFNPLPPAEYVFETKDPKNTYFFDTMKIKIDEVNIKPIEIFSREML